MKELSNKRVRDIMAAAQKSRILVIGDLMLDQLLRIGRKAFVSFPNFAHWRMRAMGHPGLDAQYPWTLPHDSAVLRGMRGLKPSQMNTFALVTSDKLMEVYNGFFGVFFVIMIALSGVGLMVGGVGVVAIMMISVTERTREIGVRMALGATRKEILWQFLVESMTVTVIGGAIGMVSTAMAQRSTSAMRRASAASSRRSGSPIAHRGLHDRANGVIENTASAFEAAVAGNFAIECDVRLSADADAIVPFEDTVGGLDDSLGTISVLAAPRGAGAHIRRAGEDARRGDDVLPAGTLLGPLQVAAGLHANGVQPEPPPQLVELGRAADRQDRCVGTRDRADPVWEVLLHDRRDQHVGERDPGAGHRGAGDQCGRAVQDPRHEPDREQGHAERQSPVHADPAGEDHRGDTDCREAQHRQRRQDALGRGGQPFVAEGVEQRAEAGDRDPEIERHQQDRRDQTGTDLLPCAGVGGRSTGHVTSNAHRVSHHPGLQPNGGW